MTRYNVSHLPTAGHEGLPVPSLCVTGFVFYDHPVDLKYFHHHIPSSAATEMIHFDAASIRQIVGARRARMPEVWLADPEQYEQGGRILRDSVSPRMLAYSRADRVLYATDGCNSCVRPIASGLESLSADELKTFAEENELRAELLADLVSLVISGAA